MSKQRSHLSLSSSVSASGESYFAVPPPPSVSSHEQARGERRAVDGAVRHAAQVDGAQASRLSSSVGSGAARTRFPGRSGEDETDTTTVAAAAGARDSKLLLDELPQLNPESAPPITPLGLKGCFRLLLLLLPPPTSPDRKHMPVASEMILPHCATSSCHLSSSTHLISTRMYSTN
jgi:hypothetical protein